MLLLNAYLFFELMLELEHELQLSRLLRRLLEAIKVHTFAIHSMLYAVTIRLPQSELSGLNFFFESEET